MKNNKGFSLVELIVVIAIMAVLVGVLAPMFIRYVEKSRMSIDVQNVALFCRTVQNYAAETESIPLPDETLTLTYGAPAVATPYWEAALENAHINLDDAYLRSNSWFANGTSITITASDLANPEHLKFSEAQGVLKPGLSLINGKTTANSSDD